jgi:tRNA pseudouridine55 synthase
MPKYTVLDKSVGQTPLDAIKEFKRVNPELARLPMAYAGRLDPMASGKLLILIGDECKHQESYHGLDKEYEFRVLFGTASDTGDVLGRLSWDEEKVKLETVKINEMTEKFIGKLSLPYPRFSSKTVLGKPLHTWTLENRLSEITMPVAETEIFKLEFLNSKEFSAGEIFETAVEKINSIPPVTDERKALGKDFRREDIRLDWKLWLERHKTSQILVADFVTTVESGTYIRSLAEELGRRLGVKSLAFAIHRSKIGSYQKLPFGQGFWRKTYDLADNS